MYTFNKRTSPPPYMEIFDVPGKTSCIVYRERTNTPLQALVMLNDPSYVEAALVFAERVVREGGERAGLVRSLVRNVLRVVDGLPTLGLLGVILISLTSERTRVGDLVAGTRVVRIGKVDVRTRDAEKPD